MKKFAALLMFPVLACAEPGPATQYLINEPATLLDVGMIRLEKLATEFENRVGLHWTNGEGMRMFKASIHPSYVMEDDRIYMYITAMNSEPTELQMAEGCQNAMYQMNIWLLKAYRGFFFMSGMTIHRYRLIFTRTSRKCSKFDVRLPPAAVLARNDFGPIEDWALSGTIKSLSARGR